MAKAPKNGGTARAPRRRGMGAVSLLVAIMLVVLFFDSVILLAAGMIPTGVAYLVDRSPSKHAARTVGWLNLSSCLMVLLDLWDGSGGLGPAMALLGEPLNWVIMFAGAAFGWGLYFALPPTVAGYLALSHEMKLKDLARRQKRLEREWGLDVRETAPMDTLAAVEDELAAKRERDAEREGTGGAARGGAAGGAESEDSAVAEEDLGDLSDTPAGRTTAREAADS